MWKPRLRRGEMSPLRQSSSSASLTGVIEIPSRSASVGTEYIEPGAHRPETMSDRTRWTTLSRKLVTASASCKASKLIPPEGSVASRT